MKLSLIILFLLAFTGCGKIKSDTDIPKQFLSDDALEFDLIGKIKNVNGLLLIPHQWVMTLNYIKVITKEPLTP